MSEPRIPRMSIGKQGKKPAADIIISGSPLESAKTATAEDFVRALMTVVRNTLQAAWLSDTDKRGATKQAFDMLTRVIEATGDVTINLNLKSIVVNGENLDELSARMQAVVEHMAALEIGRLVLQKGIAWESFEKFVTLLSTKGEDVQAMGGFTDALLALQTEHIVSKKISFREISDEEIVVTKTEIEKALSDVEAKSVISFLKGESVSQEEHTLRIVQKAALESGQLADLIIEASQVASEANPGEDPGDVIAGTLRRAVDGLMQDPSLSTQKGKKAMQRVLGQLEKDLLERGLIVFGELGDAADSIASCIEDAKDELVMDSIAADYAKKKVAISSSEEKILKYIRAKGIDKLEQSGLLDKLEAGGLDTSAWDELLRKSGIDAPQSLENIEVIGHLATLLSAVENQMSAVSTQDGTNQKEKITEVLNEVNSEVRKLADRTNKKIHTLVESVHADVAAIDAAEEKAKKEGKGPRMSRKKMLVVLAEIVQEICQPLAVINCTIQMLSAGHLGEVNESQAEAIQLAGESVDKMQMLTDGLLGIAGFPDTMEPDAGIQQSLYDDEAESLGDQVWKK